MLPLEDSRLLKPAKSSTLAPSPLQTKPPSAPRVHSSSSPSSAYQAYRQGERDSYSASKPKPAAHPHLPSGHISSPPRPAVRKESEWSPADEKAAIRRAQNTITPAKPAKPLVTKEDDARETRRFHNQVAAARQPSAPPRVYPANFIGPIAPGATRQSSSPKPAPGPARNLPTAHHTSGSANAAERHDPDFNVVSGVTKGIIFGTRKLSPPSGSVSPPPPPLPTPESWAEQKRQIRQVGPSRSRSERLEINKANGRIMDRHWGDYYKSSPDVERVVSQPTWRNPETGKQMSFPDAKYRRPDLRVDMKSGLIFSQENKATSDAAESPSAGKQLDRDTTAIKDRAVLGKGDGPHVKVDHAIIKDSLRILGPGGNTALPGEVQKHAMITPRETSPVTRVLENTHLQGVARGASKALVPVAIGLDVVNLTNAYQKDGFGKEFRKTAGEVAGGWGGAAAGAAAGAALGSVVPGVGTVAGGIIGGIAGGITGSEFGDDIEQGAEDLGKGAVEGAKNLWHGVFG
jgi:hypothetical protein